MSILAKTTSALNTDGASAAAAQYDHEISLVDHTRPEEEALSPQDTDLEPPTPLSTTSSGDPLRQFWTREGLQREYQRRKYARYQEDRVLPHERPTVQKRKTTGINDDLPTVHETNSNNVVTPTPTNAETESPTLVRKRDTLRHHTHRVKDAVKDTVRGPKLRHQHTDAESLFDILYENQRGAFFCGIPRFSHKSLLNFDPPPWQTHTFHPSPVDITNAQLPDPGWVWASGWNNWYVDMTYGLNEPIGPKKTDRPAARARGDTDEEGWRYSFAFGQRGRWAWHGTHPWFHSFVRRRKWVRLRVKRGHSLAPEGAKVKVKSENEGHMLNAEYFTIHNSKRPTSRYAEGTDASERPDSKRYSTVTGKGWSKAEGDVAEEPVEINDMPSLLKVLRTAAIDREKIAAVRQFLDNGGEELHYLADNMHEIMSLLIFQTSRQQLSALISQRFHQTEKGQKKAKQKAKTTEATDKDQQADSSSLDHLRKAATAAEDECAQLDYWGSLHPGDKGKGDTSQNDFDACDEEDDDNEAPIGKTTIFNDDVDNSRDLDANAAPDRPAEDGQDPGEQTEVPSSHQEREDDPPESDRDTLPGDHPVPIPDDENPPGAAGDDAGLSSSPELTRFETAHEEVENDETPAETDKGNEGMSQWTERPNP